MSSLLLGRSVVDLWNNWASPNLPWDWNSYEDMQKWASYPIVGPWFEVRKNELEQEENLQYWEDYAREVGFNLDDVAYPIRNGLYGQYVGWGDYFEASGTVVSLFAPQLKKWTR